MANVAKVMFRSLLRELGKPQKLPKLQNGNMKMHKMLFPLVDPMAVQFFGQGGELEDAKRMATSAPVRMLPSIEKRLDAWANPSIVEFERFGTWSNTMEKKMKKLTPETDRYHEVMMIDKRDIINLIKSEFRAPADFEKLIGNTTKSLKLIQNFFKLASCTSFSEKDGIIVELTTCPSHEKGMMGQRIFFYRVRVHNVSESRHVRLIGRHWVFKNSQGEVDAGVDKFAEGVIGQKPFLDPMETFEYYSAGEITTKDGSMEGAFLFEDETNDSKEFEFDISPTLLLS